MTTSDIAFRLLDGAAAGEHAADLETLHDEVYVNSRDGRPDDTPAYAERFRIQRRQPGFALAEARRGGYLVGYAAGMQLRPSTSWWREVTSALPADVTAEYPGRTFALTDLLVRASWRRQGIGGMLHHLLLQSRREERGTLVVPSSAAAAQSAFHNWGWHKIARTRGDGPGAALADILVVPLPLDSQA